MPLSFAALTVCRPGRSLSVDENIPFEGERSIGNLEKNGWASFCMMAQLKLRIRLSETMTSCEQKSRNSPTKFWLIWPRTLMRKIRLKELSNGGCCSRRLRVVQSTSEKSLLNLQPKI